MKSKKPKYELLDFEARAREKELSRIADMQDIASGRRTAAEVNQANNMFSSLGPEVIQKARMIIPEKD